MKQLPTEIDTPSADDDANYQRFYSAVMAQSTGESTLDTLLSKGLYGSKLPKELKGQKAADAFQHAFELIGGIPRLALWADKNPTAFFSLYSKLIPSSIMAKVDAKMEVNIKYSNPAFNQPIIDIVDVAPPYEAPTE